MVKSNLQQTENWYLLYTNPRAEKKVKIELDYKGFHSFLPLQKIQKQWSDRKKWVEEPLFKSYIFIKTSLEKNYYNILNTPGIVKFVSFENKPVLVNEKHIQTIELLLGNFENIETEPYEPVIGDMIEIIAGPLTGIQAKLLSCQGKHHVFLEMPEIMQNIKLQLPINYIKPI
ncbi:MAG: UpxY family transcription antiterminator [Bacteroidia bacterium]